MVLYCSYYWTSIQPVNWTAILAVTQSSQSTGQPSWQSLNQTSQLDSHPGSHSITPVNWTAILAATQSDQPSNPGRRQADLKGGLGGLPPPQEESDDGGGGFPRILESGRSLGPTCPGTKYPVRGIPHFDDSNVRHG